MRNIQDAANRLDRFKELCLDPLPDEALVDTDYNRIVRDTRHSAWMSALQKTRCMEAMHTIACCNWKHTLTLPLSNLPSMEECTKLWRQATAEQLTTPVRSKLDLEWKRRTVERKRKYWYLPISIEVVEAAIAKDEAFLAAHPTRRSKNHARH